MRALAALKRPPVERQGPRRVTQRPHASGQIVQAGERLWILLAEHPLAALKRPPVKRPLFCKSRVATVHETPTFSPVFLTFAHCMPGMGKVVVSSPPRSATRSPNLCSVYTHQPTITGAVTSDPVSDSHRRTGSGSRRPYTRCSAQARSASTKPGALRRLRLARNDRH
jgi:hypothetical protein